MRAMLIRWSPSPIAWSRAVRAGASVWSRSAATRSQARSVSCIGFDLADVEGAAGRGGGGGRTAPGGRGGRAPPQAVSEGQGGPPAPGPEAGHDGGGEPLGHVVDR